MPPAIKSAIDNVLFSPKDWGGGTGRKPELLEVKFIASNEEMVKFKREQAVASGDESTDAAEAAAKKAEAEKLAAEKRNTVTSTLYGKVAVGDGDDDEEDDDEDDGVFVLFSSNGYMRESEITSTEDVSYVSSPYLPSCVRNPRDQKPLTSNKHRAHESAGGNDNIRDELSEAIVLSHVVALVGEWVPFGSNQIVALNERLGAMDRCQGGLFTAIVDEHPTQTSFDVPPGLTQVTILDYDFVHFINFEAEINYPEEEGIVQVENFGMHLNVDGTILYGIKVEAILERQADSISLDHLSRLLVDVHQDSSQIMNDLLSQYQCTLLDMIFMGDKDNRGKFNMLMAENIEPFHPAEDYMDKSDNENELKQVIGDLHEAFDIGDDSVLIIGRDGLLVAGGASRECETMFISYLSLICKEMFIRNFFVRTFILDDLMKKVRKTILKYKENPNHIARIRSDLNEGTRDIVLLKEMLEYLDESLKYVALPERPEGPESTDSDRQLYDRLNVHGLQDQVELRVRDLKKLVEGASHELHNLQQMTDVINTQQLEIVFKNVEYYTKYLVDASAANERSSKSLEKMQFVVAASLMFSIIDRLSGGTLNITVPDWVNIYLKDWICDIPFLWFILNCILALGMNYGIITFMAHLAAQQDGALTLRVKVNKRVNMEAMMQYVATKDIEVADTVTEELSSSKKIIWLETDKKRWRGDPPKIEVLLDPEAKFILLVAFTVNNKRTELDHEGLLTVFMTELLEAGVLDESLEDPADLKGDNYNHLPTMAQLVEMQEVFASERAVAKKAGNSAPAAAQNKVAPG
jgi:WD repeat-containing protein 35